jgi:CheY-like chemotaxis protein
MKHNALLIEDEQDTADLLKHVLEREGISVFQAKDGRQAATLIRTVRPPSLVLLDLVIPYVSGTEILRIIREHPDWKQIPIIVLSADTYRPDIEKALREGATAYVTKQEGSAGLLQAVKRILPATPTQAQPTAKATTTASRKECASVRLRPRSNQKKKRAA